jgi:hypothetical protein
MAADGAWGLLGVLLGGALTTGTTVLLEKFRNAKETRALAAAFRGELRALRGIVSKREYVSSLRAVVAHIETTGEGYPDLGIRAEQEYFNVFRANIDKIGKLPAPLPAKIAEFYVCANSILEDFRSMSTGSLRSSTPEQQLMFLRSLLKMFEDTLAQADSIVAIIESRYPDDT